MLFLGDLLSEDAETEPHPEPEVNNALHGNENNAALRGGGYDAFL